MLIGPAAKAAGLFLFLAKREGELDRGAARAAIVDAARAVAERDGVESLTLSKVAVEAGLPRAAVYRQFTRKEDLLMSIVSDDLATLARTMKGIDWPDGGAYGFGIKFPSNFHADDADHRPASSCITKSEPGWNTPLVRVPEKLAGVCAETPIPEARFCE